jgi:hypothetical protein
VSPQALACSRSQRSAYSISIEEGGCGDIIGS